MYLFSNVLGVFVFDGNFNVVDEILFKTAEDCKNKEELVEKIKNKHKNAKEPDEVALRKILLYFKKTEFFSDFHAKNLQLAKSDVKKSVHEDTLIIQAIDSIGELDKAANILVKRLREWYDLYNPEFSRATESHEEFVEEIIGNEKSELLKKINIDEKNSIGAELSPEDIEPIKSLA